jgi:hypothetical protein
MRAAHSEFGVTGRQVQVDGFLEDDQVALYNLTKVRIPWELGQQALCAGFAWIAGVICRLGFGV